MTQALEVSHLTKSFNGVTVLREMEMEVAAGEVRALVGANGSGKSTFIKILSGYLEPDRGGEISVDGRRLEFGSSHSSTVLGCRFVHQDLGLVDGLSVADNLFLSSGFPRSWGTIRRGAMMRDARRALHRMRLEIDPARSVGELTGVERTEVALARALAGRGAQIKVLVLDEPTATLPDRQVSELLETVREVARRGVAVVYVSHRLDEVFQLADSVTVLRDGVTVATATVASLDRAGLVTLMVGARNARRAAALARAEAAAGGETVLSVSGLTGDTFRDVSIELHRGEIVGLAGLAGSGADAVLASIFGRVAPLAGQLEMRGRALRPGRPDLAVRAGIGYVPPDRKRLGGAMSASAAENLTIADLRPFWRRMHLHRAQEGKAVREWFDLLGVEPRDGAGRPLGSFSGGNQQKVVLAKWLRTGPAVLLLDEPTQGVDIAARAEIHRELVRQARDGIAIIVSSTDTDELCRICDRIVVFRRGAAAVELPRALLDPHRVTRECLGDATEAAVA